MCHWLQCTLNVSLLQKIIKYKVILTIYLLIAPQTGLYVFNFNYVSSATYSPGGVIFTIGASQDCACNGGHGSSIYDVDPDSTTSPYNNKYVYLQANQYYYFYYAINIIDYPNAAVTIQLPNGANWDYDVYQIHYPTITTTVIVENSIYMTSTVPDLIPPYQNASSVLSSLNVVDSSSDHNLLTSVVEPTLAESVVSLLEGKSDATSMNDVRRCTRCLQL